MHTVLEFRRIPQEPCAHPYCIPALFACTSTTFEHSLHAFLLFPSPFLRAHFYCIPALCACISIMFKHFLCAFLLFPLLCSSIFCVHFHCFGRLSGLLLGCSTFSEAFWTALDCFWALWTDLDCFLASALLETAFEL